MTIRTKRARCLAAIPAAAMTAILLAGCSSGNIGESWQCPLAKGGSCDSVAAADPAVPDAGGRTARGEPLWQVRGSAPEARGETACTAGCGGGFDPFGWLARLFGVPDSSARPPGSGAGAGSLDSGAGAGSLDSGAGAGDGGSGDRAAPEDTLAAPTGPVAEIPSASGKAIPEKPASGAAEPATAPLPAEPAAAEDGPAAGDLRTGEVVARIWIAPFVDVNGVYREASHIRVVLEPAGWRLP